MRVIFLALLAACNTGTKTIGGDDTSSDPDDTGTGGGDSVDLVTYSGPAIVLNEVMADGNPDATTAQDGGDWVEIFNPTSSAVTLDGYGLDVKEIGSVDDVWTLPPATTIDPGGYLYVACSHAVEGDNGIKLGLNIEFDGDRVALYQIDPDAGTAALVDEVSWESPIALPDSYARLPDGSVSWDHDATPTPGGANG